MQNVKIWYIELIIINNFAKTPFIWKMKNLSKTFLHGL